MINPKRLVKCGDRIVDMGLPMWLQRASEVFAQLQQDPVANSFCACILEDKTLTKANISITSLAFGFSLGLLYSKIEQEEILKINSEQLAWIARQGDGGR